MTLLALLIVAACGSRYARVRTPHSSDIRDLGPSVESLHSKGEQGAKVLRTVVGGFTHNISSSQMAAKARDTSGKMCRLQSLVTVAMVKRALPFVVAASLLLMAVEMIRLRLILGLHCMN